MNVTFIHRSLLIHSYQNVPLRQLEPVHIPKDVLEEAEHLIVIDELHYKVVKSRTMLLSFGSLLNLGFMLEANMR